MGKAIFGVLILLVFLWFLRRAWVFFRGRREMDNVSARLERAEDLNTLKDMENRAEELEAQLNEEKNDN